MMKRLIVLPTSVLILVGFVGSSGLAEATGMKRSPTVRSGLNSPLPPLLPADRFLPDVPVYPSFNSQRLDQQLQIYASYLNAVGAPDVLVVGSSRALQGVDPVVLQQALGDRGYPESRVYNFSINGATAQVIDLVLQRILLPDHLPKLLIWADGSRAFNSGRLDVTYNGIVASEGYKRLETGDRPLPTVETPEVRLAGRLRGVSDLSAVGFQSVAERFDPTTYYQQRPRVSGQYDTNYSSFRLNGTQTAATVSIARFANAQTIPLVFVSLPLTQDYLDADRRNYEQQFQRYMRQLAAQENFVFYDLSLRWLDQNDYFADPSHLNQEGARAVAQAIAAEPLIPWSRLEQNP
ncbi:hypothetical protein IQ268_04595 [Oculatella sp. LEGE 06141]|uniref:hypothetical protein n=1 Tax=Oculatella sp. LEGE 06141 TaxID=1828648 RepID=UPI0018823AA4|nr:hypothetical protein [Oculatella sp. LEGE 06141]MBE9177861.1 hypothetical protein [Oculatella sp. LEGE 06141]